MEEDNRELTRHIKTLLETLAKDTETLDYHKTLTRVLEGKVAQLTTQIKELSHQLDTLRD